LQFKNPLERKHCRFEGRPENRYKAPEIHGKELLPESFKSSVEGPRSPDEYPRSISQSYAAGVRT